MELHFGDEQFEVDAAQLPIAFTQVTLGGERGGEIRDRKIKRDTIKCITTTVLLLEDLQVCWLKET